MQTGLKIARVLDNPREQWQAIRNAARGNRRTAYRALDVDWKKYNTDEYLFTHDTACCSVATEENGYWIKPACWELVNANGNAWTNVVLLGSYKTFVGGENFCEHLQLPALSKGKILDAIIRPVHHHSEQQNADADIYYVDVLVATSRKHSALVEKIESGKLNTLSMGTICNGTTCSICGKRIYDGDKNCEHLDRHLGKMVKCSDGKERICAELCFPAGTRVSMSDWTRKDISEIKVGDMVVSHTGKIRKVIETFQRNYDGELIALDIQGLPQTLKSTPNHPYLVIEQHYECACGCGTKINSPERPTNKRNYTVKYAKEHRPQQYVEHLSMIWKEAKDIRPFDIVVSPKFKNDNITEQEELAYLLGWFVAEGCYRKNDRNEKTGIVFTLNYDDEMDDAIEIMTLLNRHFTIQKCGDKEITAKINAYERKEGGHKLLVVFNNKEAANWFYQRCGEYAEGKKLSNEVMNWDEIALSAFLRGYWRGDGTKDAFGRFKVSTISENLSNQIQCIAHNLGLWTCKQIIFDQKSISIEKALTVNRDSMNFRPRYEISFYNPDKTQELFDDQYQREKNHKWRFEKDYALYKVIAVNSEQFSGQVFNIEVDEDHSYLAEGIAVHNCGCVDDNGNYEEGTNSFIEISWVQYPAFEGAVVNSFVETPMVRKAREEERDELSKLFEGNLFERLKVADVESRVALRIASEETRADRIADRIFKD